jgi:hypothetical protein
MERRLSWQLDEEGNCAGHLKRMKLFVANVEFLDNEQKQIKLIRRKAATAAGEDKFKKLMA